MTPDVPGLQPSYLPMFVYLGLRPRLLCCRAFGTWSVAAENDCKMTTQRLVSARSFTGALTELAFCEDFHVCSVRLAKFVPEYVP